MPLADFIDLRITNALRMEDTSFDAAYPTSAVALAGAPVSFAGGTPNWHSGGGGMVGTAGHRSDAVEHFELDSCCQRKPTFTVEIQ